MDPATARILRLVDLYRRGTGHRDYVIGKEAVNQPGLIKRLREGGFMYAGTADTVTNWLSQNWPPDLPWPSDIPRPPTDDVGDGASTNKGEAA